MLELYTQISLYLGHIQSMPVSSVLPGLPTSFFFLPFSSNLWESRRSVTLVRLDNVPPLKLLISVGGPDNLALRVVDHGQGGKTVTRAELATPARGDGVLAAVGWATVSVGRRASIDHIGAASGSARTGIDGEGPSARSVAAIADSLHVLDNPLRAGSHHGLFVGCRGSICRRYSK